jgi:hypothetical protein
MTYTKDTLRQIFQQPFNANEWQQMSQHYFHAKELKAEPEPINGTSDEEKGYYLGALDTSDSYRIGLFYYQIQHGNVARKRVGLRNLVKSFINPNWGEFDAALVVFDSGSVWRLSFVCDIKGENTAAKRFTYVFGESDNYYNTPVGRFDALQRNGISFENIKDAFSVERLNKDFFNGYKDRYMKFLKHINDDTKENRDYVKKLLGRLVFLQFLQKKGWMGVPANQQGWNGGDKFYLNHLIERYEGNDRLLSDVLEPLFFNTLNEPRTKDLADPRLGYNIKIPYLNGGLFDKDDLDKKDIDFPYDYFKELMDFFAMYNFTIDENDPEDSEIGIDPEMLGHIFENLLEDNKDKGAFYTPKEIVQYMCQQSIIQYIKTHMSDKECYDSIEKLIKEGVVAPVLQTKDNATELMKLLKNIKVCDPAIGSGAFPMGILYVLYYAIHHLHSHVEPNGSFDSTQVKREIIQNNIFGVDIEQGAVDIARLRFWLALVVDADEPQPLPNLDYKITCGNSQLCRYSLDIPIKDVFEEYNRVEKEKAHKENKEWKEFTLDSYRNLVMDYTEEHSDKDGLRNKINEIKNCFKTTLAIGDIKKRQLAESKVIDYETVTLFGKRKADEDPVGYANAKAALRKLKEKESEILNNKKYENSFEWRFEYPQLLDSDGNFVGFDIVIANPPYIKEGRMSKAFFEPYKDSPYYKGKMDIWYLFACNGLDLLNKNGILCFIATNNWVTSFGASKLRNKVIKETRISNIVDFGAVMMFESASIQTMIMLFQKDSVTDDYSFDYRRLTAYKATEKDAAAILSKTAKEAEYFSPTIRRANFIDKSITFSRSADIIGQIESLGNRIFLQNKELTNGIHPHFDFINKKLAEKYNLKIGEGVFGLNIFEVDNLNLTEKELQFLKPYYNSSDSVYRYYLGSTDLRIIYTTSSFKNPNSMDNYPHLKMHLDKYQNVITSDNKPYGLHRSRVETFFKGEKIVALRKCADRPLFAYANGEHYMSATFYVIKTDRINMKYLTGLLNSRLIEFWLKNKGKMQGANYQLDKEPLMQIPIAVPDRETQELIAKLVDIIILLKSSKQRASNLVTNDYLANEFSHIIDGCVYEIYFPNEMSSLGLSIVPQLLTQTEGHPIDLESVWLLFSAIDKSGIIESIKSLSFSKSEVLRTISLS